MKFGITIKKVLSMLLLVCILAGLVPVDMITQANAAESTILDVHGEELHDHAINLAPTETGEISTQGIVEDTSSQEVKAVTPTPATYTNAIFIDFKNANADQTRYNTAAYTKKNFDTATYWNVNNNSSSTGTITMDNTDGKLTAKPNGDWSGLVLQPSATGANDPGAPFSYSTANAEVLQYRMRIKNLKTSTAGSARVCFDIYNGSTKASVGDFYITDAQIAGTEDVVVTMELPPSVRSLGTMTKFRWLLTGMTFSSSSSVEVDYIYIGPKSGLSTTVYGHTYHFRGEPEGQATNWTLNNISGATFDSANSILKGTGTGDAQVINKTPLNHVIESGDIMEVRLKTSAATKVYFFYATTDGLGFGNTTTSGSPEKTTAGAYTTVRYSFATANVGKAIKTIRIDPVDTNGHTFEIDYIYIGPSNKAPTNYKNYLLFDFDQTEEGDRRYTSEYYGDRDYNSTQVCEDELGTTGVWYINGNQISGISMANGLMTVTNEATQSGGGWGYIGTADSLRYPTNEKDIVQVKIKFVDMTAS